MQMYTFGQTDVYKRIWCRCLEPIKTNDLHHSDAGFVVGFCGTLYYGIRTHRWVSDKLINNGKEFLEVKYYFDLESYIRRREYSSKEDIRRASAFFKIVEDDTHFIRENSPIIFDNICCPLEPNKRSIYSTKKTLETIGFNKIVAKEDAYTKLCGYIGGVLSSEHKAVPTMSDSIKIHSHGFDKKSFRTR